jgi:hypothetical protein
MCAKGAFDGEIVDGALTFYNVGEGGTQTLRCAGNGTLSQTFNWSSETPGVTTLERCSDGTDYRVIEQQVQGIRP